MSIWTIQVRAQGEGPPTEVRVRKFLKLLLRTAKLKCVGLSEEKPEPKPITLKPGETMAA